MESLPHGVAPRHEDFAPAQAQLLLALLQIAPHRGFADGLV